ncbi:serine hydrolase [Paucibacter sp. R3-3]|uniref:Serine hydrolase n=1 Tax=Roseateles agri TaxID=3098619 RepID=A0ABU5DC78_9BURK|nr:serine hydrolase [Paucibacter sp. R3-3]MDY0742889.1 serine hydrolase [Paucibacter sp. R3-3]
MKRRTPILLLGTLSLAACGHLSPQRAAAVSTGYVSHQLCTAVFVGGRDPQTYYRDAVGPLAGPLAALVDYTVDTERHEVRARIAGMVESRAVFRPPYGCSFGRAPGPDLPAPEPSPLPAAPSEALVQTSDPALATALDHAFEENAEPPYRHTEAVVVMHRGRIVAERYASDVGVDTPLAGWSATKSVTNALIGILVHQGRLALHGPAPIAAWADPADPRHAISVDELLRMNSGLDMGQSIRAGLSTAFDPTAQMIFVDADTAADAERAGLANAPGTAWNYTNANTQLLSRIVRDQAGGTAAATLAFARRELFDKLGMRHVTLEFDGAGTPIGASHMWAPARDWARFGQLYLHDGVIDGERLLPAGWVDDSATPTPGAEDYGYGAGFWTNRGAGSGARYRIEHGMPAESFMARGSHGQYVVIVPSKELVIARLGPAWTPRDDMDRVAQLTREVIAALNPERATAPTGAPPH